MYVDHVGVPDSGSCSQTMRAGRGGNAAASRRAVEQRMIWVRLINRSLERAGQPESDKDRRSSPGWLRSLRKEAAMEDRKKEGYF